MDSDPLIRRQLDAELAARLERVSARRTRTAPPTSRTTPPTSRTAVSPRIASSPPPPPPPGAGPARKKRRHPARHSRSAALALSFVTTTGLAYAFAVTNNNASANVGAPAGLVGSSQPVAAPATTAAPNTAPAVDATAPTTAPATTAPATTTAPVATPTVVNGASVRNRYGNVQVQATFGVDGTLTNVDVIEAPSRDGQSIQINNYAVPRLNSEALTAQSANVHTISGATYTSIGYAQSLQSAIDVARANGLTTIS
jgi:uncharacterized protein with FMN-binding domain